MRAGIVAGVTLAATLMGGAASAQDVETLRKELDQMRQRFERMQQEYQSAIQTMAERLQRLETQPQATAAPPPAAAQAPPPAPAAAGVTASELLRVRQPFALYQQRGAGQLLFDMGVVGDFIGNVTQRNVQKASGGSFAGLENRFFPREIELVLFGQVDPYARAEVRIEAGEEERGQETGVALAEAHVTLLTLPWGLQAKLGQMRNRFGWSNQIHEHDLPWPDRPNVFRNFLGAEALQEKGVEVTLVPELPFYLEGLVGVFNGDNETSFGRGSLREPLVTGRLRTFLEPTDTTGLQLGVFGAAGTNPDRRNTTLLGGEARFKHRPEGWLHPLFTLTGEALYSMRRTNVDDDPDEDGSIDRIDKRDHNRFGWYAGAELQPWRRWAGGVRYDWSQYPVNPGREWAVEPYLTFKPSEFLRFRLAYKHTDRSHREGFDPDGRGGSARLVDEWLFQATFILGAHRADNF